MTATNRPIFEIATEAQLELNNAKFPVTGFLKLILKAMATLTNVSDVYGDAKARDVIIKFLTLTSDWNGETAKKVKLELNVILK
mgnify:CR=1 FL=1